MSSDVHKKIIMMYHYHMNKEEQVLLRLINKSQFGSSEPIDYSNVDMDALYNEALNQSVLGLIAPEIPSEYASGKWMEAIYRQKSSYIRYCHAQDELKNVLDDAAIPFVILKGNASAVSYSDPSRRTMGDIDFLVPQDLFDRSKKILINNNYILVNESAQYTRHIGFLKNGIHFELHRHFSHFEEINIEDYVIEGLANSNICSIDGHEFPMLSKLANGLVLLDHFRRHLQSAVGLRQVIDWMMYVYRNLDDEFWNNEFGPVAKAKGMDILAIVTTRMCQIYLGLPETITWCMSADTETCERLMNLILDSGNFGRKNGRGTSIEAVTTSIKKNGLFRRLQKAGEFNWKAYHKHHWLKPFCWIYQGFRYAKQGIKSGRNREQLKNDLKRSKERVEVLKRVR